MTRNKALGWLDKNPKDAAEWAAVKFPPRTVYRAGDTVVKRDTITRRDTVVYRDSDGTEVRIPCPECDAIYVTERIRDTIEVINSAGEEKERLRANEAEREVAVKDGQLVSEKEKAKNRLYWIISLGVLCTALFAFILRKVF